MKRIILTAAAISAAVTLATPASAAIIFEGYATGCFGASCTPSTSAQPTTTVSTGVPTTGFSYTTSSNNIEGSGNSFFQTTNSLGQAGLGAGPLNTAATSDLGYFTLTSAASNYSDVFKLLVTFALPAGAGATTMTAAVTGQVLANQNGDVTVHFANDINNPLVLTYNGGSFSFYLNDVDVPGTSAGTIITGKVSVLPEPETWGMMLFGFAGIGAVMRRKRKATLLPQLA